MANLNVILLHAPHGLSLALDLFHGPSREARVSEILDTLQILADQLDDHYIEASRLRGLVFALQEGDQAEPALRKIAAELSAIPEPIFRAAADHVIQSRPLRFVRREKAVADFLRAIHARSGPPISQEAVPMILRLTAQALLENENGRRATHALERIKQSLREAYGQMKTAEEKRLVLQQYSYFVILTSGLIPTDAEFDLALLPQVVFEKRLPLMDGSSRGDAILINEETAKTFSQEKLFHLVRHESFHVLQKIEALGDPDVNEEFKEFAGKNLSQLVASQQWGYARGSAALQRSRWLEKLFASYNRIVSERKIALLLLDEALKKINAAFDFFGLGDDSKTISEKAGQVVGRIIQEVERDPKLGKPVADQLRALVKRVVDAERAYLNYPIEAMAETSFAYGRSGEVIDAAFERAHPDLKRERYE